MLTINRIIAAFLMNYRLHMHLQSHLNRMNQSVFTNALLAVAFLIFAEPVNRSGFAVLPMIQLPAAASTKSKIGKQIAHFLAAAVRITSKQILHN